MTFLVIHTDPKMVPIPSWKLITRLMMVFSLCPVITSSAFTRLWKRASQMSSISATSVKSPEPADVGAGKAG